MLEATVGGGGWPVVPHHGERPALSVAVPVTAFHALPHYHPHLQHAPAASSLYRDQLSDLIR